MCEELAQRNGFLGLLEDRLAGRFVEARQNFRRGPFGEEARDGLVEGEEAALDALQRRDGRDELRAGRGPHDGVGAEGGGGGVHARGSDGEGAGVSWCGRVSDMTYCVVGSGGSGTCLCSRADYSSGDDSVRPRGSGGL